MRTMVIRATLVVASAILAVPSLVWGQQPLSTAFTVQGHLDVAGSSGNGPHDFRCKLFADPSSAAQIGGNVDLDDVLVDRGTFTLAPNFGDVFTNRRLWLEIAVRDGASTGGYTTLSPRMELTPAPFAHHAVDADLATDALLLGGSPKSAFATASHHHDASYAPLAHTHGDSFYGDGSAGSLTVAANTDWSSSPPAGFNLQFTDLTVNPGVTLTVPSGLTIRVTGAFENAGIIVVQRYEAGGTTSLRNASFNSRQATFGAPGAGVARRPAASGERVDGSNESAWGGPGGRGVASPASASGILRPGASGGGAGAGCLLGTAGTTTSIGGDGGGTLVVLAGGSITNTGTITADGAAPAAGLGAGGGGGGVIVLASRTSAINTGAINARGGNGGSSGVSNGAGGGGGGGIVHLVAPDASNTGTIVVTGGSPGAIGANGSVTGTASRHGGGGGGGSYGDGGNGGALTGNTPDAGTAGGLGLVLVRTAVDPTALF